MRHLFLINPTAGKNTDPDRISAEIHSLMAERGEPYHRRHPQRGGERSCRI